MRKSLIFEQNHGLSPLENLAVLLFLKLQFSGLKIIVFDPEFKKKKKYFLTWLLQKNTNKKNVDFWTKTMDYPLSKISIIFDFLKPKFSGLKLILFYPEYQETSSKHYEKKFEFWEKPWTNLLGKDRFFGAPQNVTFLV